MTSNGKHKPSSLSLPVEFVKARQDWLASKHAEVDARFKSATEVLNSYKQSRQTSYSRDTRGINVLGTSADYHYQSELDYFKLVELVRDIDRTDIVVSQGIDRLCNNIVQAGFMVDPKTGDETANRYIRDKWTLWSSMPEECDFQRERSFSENAWLVLRHAIVDGDILALLVDDGSVQLAESHRLRSPLTAPSEQRNYLVHGVLLDGDRKRVGYYLTKDDISLNEFPRYDQVAFYPKYAAARQQVLHVYHPKRVSQTRGVSKLVPAIDACGLHDEIQFAKLVQQQGVSVFALIRQRELGFELPDGVVEDGVYWEPDPCRPGQTRQIRDVGAGMWYTGYPGESVHGFSPNVPNPTFFDHSKQIMSLIALNLDLPLVLFLLDASETNFSGWRGALEQAKIAFKKFQRWLACTYHSRVFEWQLERWSDPRSPAYDPILGRMRNQGLDVFAHEWVFPSWPYVEPLKDVQAQMMRVSNGLASYSQICKEMSSDWDTLSTQIVDDRATGIIKGIERSIEINKTYPDLPSPVLWQDLWPLSMPDGVQSNIAPKPASEPASEPATEESDDDL